MTCDLQAIRRGHERHRRALEAIGRDNDCQACALLAEVDRLRAVVEQHRDEVLHSDDPFMTTLYACERLWAALEL